ncbi:pentatricopeptide repeat-containing protein At4g14050, mitochondrial-like [Selaginella moellendorffii]|uniref:pentatricopeptide repeat-containing protein At4g14050, mitochondrial-like n=1 Tax=Selaginella moellendorffii TaxID=88036 RepID=UPI000D1C9662|nr:pentatricopeptide repeat-containing protein At4g14050, mitochondrial-like [Selaginella moellendorffii]|eukprot:XP_024540242.1 pentatricopeptide repeat-containing protein At4g14050, mitochondrial-like [Selaginella moellendorffii]
MKKRSSHCSCFRGWVPPMLGLMSQLSASGCHTEAFVANSLVDMYARCGSLDESRKVLDTIEPPNAASWTGLLLGYVDSGKYQKGLELIRRRSHAGLVNKGKMFFQMNEFGAPVEAQHYSCMIDLLGRADRLDEVIELLGKIPERADQATWMTVLSACWKWKNVAVGELAFQSFSSWMVKMLLHTSSYRTSITVSFSAEN